MRLGAQADCATCPWTSCRSKAAALDQRLQTTLAEISGPAALWWPCPRGVHSLGQNWPELPEVALLPALPPGTTLTAHGPAVLALAPRSRMPEGPARDLKEQLQLGVEEIAREAICQDVHWWMTEDLHRLLFCTSNYEQVFGLSLTDLYHDPTSFLAAVHPEDRQGVVADLHAYLQRGGWTHQVFYRLLRPDGRILPVSTRISRLETEFGVVMVGCVYPLGPPEDPPGRAFGVPALEALLRELEQALSVGLAVGRPTPDGKIAWLSPHGQLISDRPLADFTAERPGLLRPTPDLGGLSELLGADPEWVYALPERAWLAIVDPAGQGRSLPAESVGPGVARLVSLHLRGQALSPREMEDQLVQVREEELRMLARELHDNLGQLLTAMKIQVLRLQASRAPRKQLADLDRMASEALEVTRRLVRRLRPVLLEEQDLLAALRRRADQLHRVSGMDIQVEGNLPAYRLDSNTSTALFRIAQEGLTNCLRHSGAHKVVVRVVAGRKEVGLVVEDDGQGCLLPGGGGLGLLHIRERVEQLGGSLLLESEPGQGFRLSVSIPENRL